MNGCDITAQLVAHPSVQGKKNAQKGPQSLYAAIAQLGERQTEDLKVPGSIPGLGTF